MLQCCARWEHVDETPYLIEVDPAERGGSPFEELEDTDPGEEDGVDEVQIDVSEAKWDDIDDEFQAFMDESDETDDASSDSESVRSEPSMISESKPAKRKRKRTTESADGSEAEDSDASTSSTSRLQRRKKRTMERVSSLTNVVTAEKSSGLPSPETTGPEEDTGELEKDPDPAGLAAEDSDPEEDDGLEAEMLAEFERSASDEA
jgi:RNA polymerase II subunit A-like phosphatase